MLANVQTVARYAQQSGAKQSPSMLLDIARETAMQIERYATWDHRLMEGQIAAVADYSTGTCSITQGSTALTFTGATLTQAMITRHWQPSGTGGRWYQFSSINEGAGTAVLLDPFEGSDLSLASYTIRQRYYRLPPDFDKAAIQKETTGNQVVRWWNREDFEAAYPTISATGQVWNLIFAGSSRTVLYNTGTVTLTLNSASVTGSGTSFLQARDLGRRFRPLLHPEMGDFTISAVGGTTSLTLDRAWTKGTCSAQLYQIDPIGEMMVEPFPSPAAGNSSIHFYYYAVPPPLFLEIDQPRWPMEMNQVWKDATVLRCMTQDPDIWESKFSALMGAFMKRTGLEANRVVPSLPWGVGPGGNRSNLPWNWQPYSIISGR